MLQTSGEIHIRTVVEFRVKIHIRTGVGAIFGVKIANKVQCNLWRVPFMDNPGEGYSYLNFRETQ